MSQPRPNKSITCCICATRREVFTSQPDGPCRLFCPKCQCHRTHTRAILHPKPVVPFSRRETAQILANSVRHLTEPMQPKNPVHPVNPV